MQKKIIAMLLCMSFIQNTCGMGEWFDKTIAKPVKKSAVKTGRAISSGVKKAGSSVSKGATTVAKGAEKGLKETGQFIQKEVISPLESSFQKLDSWRLPNRKLRFDQVAYLGAHNAHVNQKEGFKYSQQLWGLDDQLKNGVRHFLLDLWIGQQGANKGKVLLCHGECEKASRGQRFGGINHVAFKTYLLKIKRFLDTHPNEIVSLELENYVDNNKTNADIRSIPGLSKYVLLPSEYDPANNKGQWPTLDWMIKNNKRLVIFDSGNSAQYGYNTSDYLTRNMYGTHVVDEACRVRNKGSKSNLVQMNYFGTVASPLPNHNAPSQLQKVWSRCQSKQVVPSGKAPNFVALDNVHLGNAMKWINELNAKAAKNL